MKAVVAAFNQEKALVGAFSVITNLQMELLEALNSTSREEISKIKLLKEKTTYSQNTGSWFSSLFRGHFCGLGIVETNFADNKF